MISDWLTFNENLSDSKDIKKILSSRLSDIREVFLGLEDMGIIEYGIIPSGYERGGYGTFDPKNGNFDRFIDSVVPVIKSFRPILSKIVDKDVCIIADIRLPGESNKYGNTVIGNEGIKLFDDILSANSRLIDDGYDIRLDLNSSHHKYYPVKFLIYFNL